LGSGLVIWTIGLDREAGCWLAQPFIANMQRSRLQEQFMRAVAEGRDPGRIRDLIAAGADINCSLQGPGTETPLLRAVAGGQLTLVRLLLEAGADINLGEQGARGWSPLMCAHDNPALIRELLAAGAQINSRTPVRWMTHPTSGKRLPIGGETVLHLAAAANNAEVVALLAEAGADLESPDASGRGPLDYALANGSANAAAVALVEAGARLTPQRLELMHSAAHRPDSDLVSFPWIPPETRRAVEAPPDRGIERRWARSLAAAFDIRTPPARPPWRMLKRCVAVNFVLSALAVFVWVAFGLYAGKPMEAECLGFHRGSRLPNGPAWVTPVLIQAGFLVVFCLRRRVGEGTARFFLGGIAAFTLVFMLLVPLLLQQVYGTSFYTFDKALWWYACFSSVLLGLVGTNTED
jgi:Ankyrin repeats (3 copies)